MCLTVLSHYYFDFLTIMHHNLKLLAKIKPQPEMFLHLMLPQLWEMNLTPTLEVLWHSLVVIFSLINQYAKQKWGHQGIQPKLLSWTRHLKFKSEKCANTGKVLKAALQTIHHSAVQCHAKLKICRLGSFNQTLHFLSIIWMARAINHSNDNINKICQFSPCKVTSHQWHHLTPNTDC